MSKVRAIFAVLTVVTLFGTAALFCSAGGGSPSDEKAILGTWINNEDTEEYVFAADGKLVINKEDTCKYAVAENLLALKCEGGSIKGRQYSISSDKKTLIYRTWDGDTWWFTRK